MVEPRPTEESADEAYDPENDPNVIMAEKSAEELNKLSEKAAEMDEVWQEARPNEEEAE
jgi:hypothetical protein